MQNIECVVDAKNKLGEVPVWCPREQALYWIDIEGCLLQRFIPELGEVKVWKMPERIGSFAIRETGGLIVAFASGFAFYDLETEKIQWLSKPESHIPRNRFNDGKCDRNGRFWAGTMDDQLSEHTAALYCYNPDGTVQQRLKDVGISNSLAWSPENDKFYFADTLDGSIYVFDYDHDSGQIANKRVFATTEEQPGVPDGSTIDEEGYLWNAQWDGWRLVRYAPSGEINQIVDLPVQKPTSCMFGGANLDTLYVTSAIWDLSSEQLKKQPHAGGVLAIDVGVKGLPEPRFKG
ncbi:MAG: SMP-30/gluconolactonase/LRE family protein [SAR324 cluster bacterium]|nr:SMP-30/gluconolactonase/LRE family protein [SAR324 cluster bacterium]